MPIHAESQLERLRYGAQSWSEVMRDNAQLLEDTLLQLSNLLDIEITSLQDGDILWYNSISGKFENVAYTTVFSTTTTSSTTTTTSPP